MPRYDARELLTTRESFSSLTVDELKPLAALVGKVPLKKGDLVDLLAGVMENLKEVEALYARMDDVSQKALQEAIWRQRPARTHFEDGGWLLASPARRRRHIGDPSRQKQCARFKRVGQHASGATTCARRHCGHGEQNRADRVGGASTQ